MVKSYTYTPYIAREVHANVYNVYLPSLSPLSVRHRLLFFFPLKHILPFLFQIEAPATKKKKNIKSMMHTFAGRYTL